MRRLIKKVIRNLGFNIHRNNLDSEFLLMVGIILTKQPMIFDVGANIGQTTSKFLQYFPRGIIHSFEPHPQAFEVLKKNSNDLPNVQTWNMGLGSTIGQSIFYENTDSDISSFLRQDELNSGIEKESIAQITTIDDFCAKHQINAIDILKIDTQGFELEVLKGAKYIIQNNGVKVIYCEVIFSKLYKESASLGDLYNFLLERGYKLVTIGKIYYQDGLASWSDFLFIHESHII